MWLGRRLNCLPLLAGLNWAREVISRVASVHKLVHLTAHVWAALPRALDQLRGPDEPKRAIPTALTKPNIMLTRITNFMSQLVVKKRPVGPNWAAGVGVLREVPALAKTLLQTRNLIDSDIQSHAKSLS